MWLWILGGYFFIGLILGLASDIKSRDWDLVHLLFSMVFWLPALLRLGFRDLVNRIEEGRR